MCVISKYIKQLNQRDPRLQVIYLYGHGLSDAMVVKLVDCLLVNPDVVLTVWLSYNNLTDEIGVKLAKFISISSTIGSIGMSSNKYSTTTYMAVAAALRDNTSLHTLYLHKNQETDQPHINRLFVDALRLNPSHHANMDWMLHTSHVADKNFKLLKHVAEKSTPPSMLEFLLCVHLNTEKIKTKKRN